MTEITIDVYRERMKTAVLRVGVEESITAGTEIVVSLEAAGFGYQRLGRGRDNALLTLSETKNREYTVQGHRPHLA